MKNNFKEELLKNSVKKSAKIVGFAYSRLSQKDRTKLKPNEVESSLKNAKEDIDTYCKMEGVDLLYFGEERYKSGAKWDRETIKETMDRAKEYALKYSSQIESGEIIVQFIFKNLSRMARDGIFQETNLREMEDPPYYIQIVSIEEGEVVKDRSLRMILGGINERKVQEGRESTRKRHDNALGKGIPPIKAPFGYWNDRNINNWSIDEKQSKIVLEFWKMFSEGSDYKEICSNLGISKGLYYRLIDNFENYLGKIIYRKKIKNFKGKVIKVDKQMFGGKHKPIIKDKELIEKIEVRLNGERKTI